MRKLTTLAIFLCFGLHAFSQEEEANSFEKKNIIKLNLPALALKNISLQYERAVGKRISLALTARYMPDGKLPLLSLAQDISDDPDFNRQIGNVNFGNYAIIPEMRFYVGRHGAFRGFYLGPFANIGRFNISLPYEYDDDDGNTKTIPMSGNINSITGGIMFGAQWKLSNAISLDWWILGPNYGTSKGVISGKKALSQQDQQDLRDALDDLDIPLTKFTYVVDGNGATINAKGPWAGLRAGICLGIRF